MAYSPDNIVKGDQLMVFYDGKSIAYATSHTLNLTGNTVSVANKDSGIFAGNAMTTVSWEVTSDNLFSDDAYSTLFDAMMARQALTIVLGYADDWSENGLPTEGTNWEKDATKKYYSGDAYITSLNMNAATGENATFSVTFSGAGALTKTAPSI